MADNCQIWQVARATSAAPGFFPLAKVDGREFLDGGFGTNNPSHEASMELSTMHPTNYTCLVSIGSGKRQVVSRFKSDLLGHRFSYIKAAVKLATDTENIHENMRDLAARSEKFSYFRFDVPGLETILMDEWKVKKRPQLPSSKSMHTIAFIEEKTEEYLGQTDTRDSIRECAQMIAESHRRLRKPTSYMKPKAEQHILQVPARNDLFQGRKETLRRMHEHLKPQSVDKLRSCVLYGLGGIGKTQIAIEYIYRSKHLYTNIFWIRASSESQLAESYSSVARMIGHGSSKENANLRSDTQIARHWLSSTGKT